MLFCMNDLHKMFHYFILPKTSKREANCDQHEYEPVMWAELPSHSHPTAYLLCTKHLRMTSQELLPLHAVSVHCITQPFPRGMSLITSSRAFAAAKNGLLLMVKCALACLMRSSEVWRNSWHFSSLCPTYVHWWHVTVSAVRGEESKEGKG